MKPVRTRRSALLSALSALPILLAWYLAAQRSWLPTTRRIYRGEVTELRSASDGQHLISVGATRQGTRLSELQADELEADSLRPLRRLAHIKDLAAVLMFSPDFKSYIRMGGTMVLPFELCDVASGRRIWLRDPPFYVSSTTFSSSGKRLATASYPASFSLTWLQRRQEVVLLHRQKFEICAAAFSQNERLIAAESTGGQLFVWDTASRKLRHACNIRLQPDASGGTAVYRIAISPNNCLVASGGVGQPLYLWNVTSHAPARALGAVSSPVVALAFAPDNRTLASSDSSGTITLWDMGTTSRQRTFSLTNKRVTALAWSLDGKCLFSGHNDGTVARWRVK